MCQYTFWIIIFGFIVLLAICYDSFGPNYLENFDSHPSTPTLASSSPISLIDNFLTGEQCDKLVELAKNRFVTSTVYSTNTGAVDMSARSSSCAYFKRGENDLIKLIEDKVASELDINLNQIEPLQIVKYEKGQQYKYHYDYFGNETDQVQNQRVHTILVYLNDLDEADGGSTHFPLYKIRTYPYKGRAIGWNNLDSDDKENKLTLHAGEPILSDKVKYVLTIWTRKTKY